MPPTAKQRRLLHDIDELSYRMGLNVDAVVADWEHDAEGLTAHLERIIEHLVRGEVVYQYTYVDQLLAMYLFKHLFRGAPPRQNMRRWQTFWNLMDELYPMQKLRVIRGYKKVPSKVVHTIDALNALRNDAAHRFGLASTVRSTFRYKGKSLFTPEGLDRLHDDVDIVEEYFAPRVAKLAVRLATETEQRPSA